MEDNTMQEVKTGLLEKRRNLAGWLKNAPPEEIEIHLGADHLNNAYEHIHILDEALEKAEFGTLGLCKICGEPIEDEVLQMDFTAEVCLEHLSPDETRHLEDELRLSKVIQKALLPQEPPQITGLELAAFNRPAQIVGGNFFDFLYFQDARAGIIIGDVAGKGLSSGLIMASTQTALRALTPDHTSPAKVLERINQLFTHNALFATFVTLFLAAYEPATHTLTYCNAGHNPPLLIRTTDEAGIELIRLNPTGPAIGLVEHPGLQDGHFKLSLGDVLFLYTDGIPEAFSLLDEQYGMLRLENLLRQNASTDPRSVIRAILRDLQEFIGVQSPADDITIVVLRVVG